jgi:hypothetical protein
MSGHGDVLDITTEARTLDDAGPRVVRIAAAVGAIGVAASVGLGFATDGGWTRLLGSYLVSFTFWLSLALGALFFVMLQHLTRSGWSVVVRRLAEAPLAAFPVLLVLAIPIVLGIGKLYGWGHHEPGHDLGDKGTFWLNPTFFTIRIVVYFAIWIVLARKLVGLSVRQDESGDPALTKRMEAWSAPGMVLFAFTTIFAAFDLLMSLDPHWFSTIFGVYYFAGSVVAIFALLPIVAMLVQRAGKLERAITDEHYHDLGKQLFGFLVFWAYIAFSQYMLIWYGDIPEETQWFLRRQQGGWEIAGLLLLFGHFVVPFLALISRHPKRRRAAVAGMAVWILVMHWLDLHWLVLPELSSTFTVGLLDLTCMIGLGGLLTAFVVGRLKSRSLVPEKDPRLAESLAFTNV